MTPESHETAVEAPPRPRDDNQRRKGRRDASGRYTGHTAARARNTRPTHKINQYVTTPTQCHAHNPDGFRCWLDAGHERFYTTTHKHYEPPDNSRNHGHLHEWETP